MPPPEITKVGGTIEYSWSIAARLCSYVVWICHVSYLVYSIRILYNENMLYRRERRSVESNLHSQLELQFTGKDGERKLKKGKKHAATGGKDDDDNVKYFQKKTTTS